MHCLLNDLCPPSPHNTQRSPEAHLPPTCGSAAQQPWPHAAALRPLHVVRVHRAEEDLPLVVAAVVTMLAWVQVVLLLQDTGRARLYPKGYKGRARPGPHPCPLSTCMGEPLYLLPGHIGDMPFAYRTLHPGTPSTWVPSVQPMTQRL